MNLKILFMLLIYWTAWILITAQLSGAFLMDDINTTANFNESELSANESGTGGIFSTGISFGRYFTFVAFGLNTPADWPDWIQLIIAAWQTMITIFTVGWVISSIWDG